MSGPYCAPEGVKLDGNLMYLTEPTLGRLDIAEQGTLTPYVLVGYTIGKAAPRDVEYPAALGDGHDDDTQFVGPRIITATVRVNFRGGLDTQTALDRLDAYLSPMRRSRLHWTVPSGTGEVRSALVRGVDGPLVVDKPKYPTVAAQWKAPLGVIEEPVEQVQQITPGTDVEAGRDYDLTFDRQYPPSDPIGVRQVDNRGNHLANWVGTIFGPCTDPTITINGVLMDFGRNGGITLTAGTSLVVDTRARTVLLNGDPNESRYSKLNAAEFSWRDVMLAPGKNQVRLEASIATEGSLQMRWRSTWL